MFLLALLNMQSWDEYYSTSKTSQVFRGVTQFTQYKNNKPGNLYVCSAVFICLVAINNKGGALLIESNTKALIELSSFINCHATGQGGAIYYMSTNGECALKTLCSYNSSSTKSNFHFCYIKTKHDENGINSLDQLSISHLNTIISTECNVNLEEGKININSINISLNSCYNWCIMWCVPFDNSAVNCSILYSSFENNTSIGDGGMDLDTTANFKMDTCNVIGNNAHLTSHAIIRIWKSLTILNSCIVNNNKNKEIFDCDNGDITIKLINCTIDSLKNYNVAVHREKTPKISFKNSLNFNECFNKNYDSKTLKMQYNRCNSLQRSIKYLLVYS